MVSLLCLAIWLPATFHCALEKLPGLAFLQCGTASSDKCDCQGDSCDTVEKGFYKSSDHGIAVAIVGSVRVQTTLIVVPEPTPQVIHELELISSPPRQQCESWEYYSSRALGIRGPALTS